MAFSEEPRAGAVGAVAALNDPARAAIYELVSAHDEPMTRDAVAHTLGLARSTAAFHLDRLVESGLMTVAYRKLAGRGGPGSGRPAKLYTVVADEIAVSLPDRRYDLMGTLLASAIEASAHDGRPVLDALRTTATEAGLQRGREAGSLDDVLETSGYRPVHGPDGTVLTNCPFHRLAASHTDVVCAANHAFLCGAAEATGTDPADVRLEPGAGHCCVRVVHAEAV